MDARRITRHQDGKSLHVRRRKQVAGAYPDTWDAEPPCRQQCAWRAVGDNQGDVALAHHPLPPADAFTKDFGPAEADISHEFAPGRCDRISASFSVLARKGQPWTLHGVAKTCQFVLEVQFAQGRVERETVADGLGNRSQRHQVAAAAAAFPSKQGSQHRLDQLAICGQLRSSSGQHAGCVCRPNATPAPMPNLNIAPHLAKTLPFGLRG